MKSIFICNHCGKKDKEIKKIMLSGYANMLCQKCKMMFEDEIAPIARRYLKDKK